MTTRRALWSFLAAIPVLGGLMTSRAAADMPPAPPGQMMLTIFLRHDETKTVDEINQHLKTTGWLHDFPPPGVEVVSWYVMMGVGQVVTCAFPLSGFVRSIALSKARPGADTEPNFIRLTTIDRSWRS